MASPLSGRAAAAWEGGACVLRIRQALAAVVDAAERNLEVGDRKDCDARRFGFPWRMMAEDFRDKAIDLAFELSSPGPGPVSYPIDRGLPVEVRCAIAWTAEVFHQQMQFWGWGWPINLSDDDEPPRLQTRISEHDLGKLSRCLARLDEAIGRHPAPVAMAAEAQAVRVRHPVGSEPDRPGRSKSEQCIGLYLAAIARNEAPPTGAEIARIVGCNEGLVSRAIAPWRRMRADLLQAEAAERYPDSG